MQSFSSFLSYNLIHAYKRTGYQRLKQKYDCDNYLEYQHPKDFIKMQIVHNLLQYVSPFFLYACHAGSQGGVLDLVQKLLDHCHCPFHLVLSRKLSQCRNFAMYNIILCYMHARAIHANNVAL